MDEENDILFLTRGFTFLSSLSIQAPHTLQMRAGVKMGDVSLQDSMVADGLTDAFHGCHMGITGFNLFTVANVVQYSDISVLIVLISLM